MRHAALVARAGRAGVAVLFVLAAASISACGIVGGDAAGSGPVDDSSPDGVVTGFVAAEAAKAFDVSYGLLRSADREDLGSVEEWRDLHADAWPVDGGDLVGTSTDGDRATVEMKMRFNAGLVESVGLVPARGTARWLAVKEGDRWRIAFDEAKIEAEYPDEQAAPAKVVEWAKARQACGKAPEFEGGLVGFPALADQLCRRPGTIEAGAPRPLERGPDSDAVIAAFGPESLTWARVVALTAPADLLRVVVAPIGDDWTVMAALSPTPTT
jgi:hypothetical protein